MKGATKYYNLARGLTFPSSRRILIYLILASLYGEFLWSFGTAGRPPAMAAFAPIAPFGIFALLLPSILSSAIIEGALLRGDPLFHARRRMALSLVALLVWDLGMSAERLISNGPPVNSFLISSMPIIFLRTISIFTISTRRLANKIPAAVGQPAICASIAALLFGVPLDKLSMAFLLGTALSIAYSSSVLVSIERIGKARLGSSPIFAFRALLSNWLNLDRAPMEAFMESLGRPSEISASTIAFRGRRGDLLGVMVVSNFHPGPFLNVGSSGLPYAIQRIVGDLTGAVVCVPHGISGHDLNISSSFQNRILVESLLGSLDFGGFHDRSTDQIEVAQGGTQCKCQVIGDCLLMTMTTAPMVDDIPPEAVSKVLGAIESIGLKPALIDSHNRIESAGAVGMEDFESLEGCSLAAMSKAIREGGHPFKFGAAGARPEGMGLREGIGPAGVVAFVLEVLSKRIAYVVLDGNNMKLGLRERILEALSEVGISSGEVMTTDTHLVNGLIPSKLGYPVVGEVGEDKIIEAVKEAAIQAQSKLEEAEVACERRKAMIKTLGQNALESLVRSIWSFSRAIAYSVALFIAILAMVGLWAVI